MSTWRKRFSRKSQRLNENDEILLNNSVKYKKKLQAAIVQINRTKKSNQRKFDSPDSEIHVARLINDIGQLSDCKPLQEITGLVDSLAMRHQLSSRIFNEYAMNSLQQSLQNLNDNLSNDLDRTKSVLEEAANNHCQGGKSYSGIPSHSHPFASNRSHSHSFRAIRIHSHPFSSIRNGRMELFPP